MHPRHPHNLEMRTAEQQRYHLFILWHTFSYCSGLDILYVSFCLLIHQANLAFYWKSDTGWSLSFATSVMKALPWPQLVNISLSTQINSIETFDPYIQVFQRHTLYYPVNALTKPNIQQVKTVLLHINLLLLHLPCPVMCLKSLW